MSDVLDRWQSSANAMMILGDVHEQGYAERILKLIRLVKAQREALEKLQRNASEQLNWALNTGCEPLGLDCSSIYTTTTQALTLTVEDLE